ncbi:TPA: shikimate dehydrogenase [bacterium]|nr:shikimate dehydrogenase [bacterium]
MALLKMGIRLMTRITGHTKIIGVIGDPVEHSRSPQMHNSAIQELGLDYVYVPFHVKPDQIIHAINGFKALNVVGINVTLPHKKSVLPLMDEVSKEAELIGAVNTMVFRDGKVFGHNTDAKGFIASLNEEGINNLKGMKVIILGAGGSAQAIVTGLAIEGVSNIVIANRTLEKAISLASEMSEKTGISIKGISLNDSNLSEFASNCDLLVSTVTSGMDIRLDPVINLDWLKKDCIVCDIVYTPPETNLLISAKNKGLKTIGGMGMLVNQGAISFQLWTGISPPVKIMREALFNALFG